jgi:probable phosphoglycerate mutase
VTTRFLLLRHAEAAGNAAGQTQGRIDHELTDRGRRQAATVAASLLPYRPVALYASTAARARSTAEVVAEACGLDLVLDERLLEIDHGELDGLDFDEIRERHGAFLEQWRDEEIGDLRFPGGESMAEARARMLEALDEAGERHGEADVVVVSHNLALKSLLTYALGVSLGAQRRFQLDLASLSVVERRPGENGGPSRWSVVGLNERCHLPEDAPPA